MESPSLRGQPGLSLLIVRPVDLKRVVGISSSTAFRLEHQGRFPKRRQLGPRATGWLLSDLEEWLRSRPEASQRAGSRRRPRGVDNDLGL
jgi:prophage regulatory protein